MTKRKSPSKNKRTVAPALANALEGNRSVKVEVDGAATDLASAGDVLKQRIAGGDAKLPAKVALKVSEKVEEKVLKASDELAHVNATLEEGVAALERTEETLVKTQAKLADTEHALVASQEGEREARLEARHDTSTGLPNRDHFNSRLTHDIAVAARQGFGLAVMFFDLDKFKRINDSLGHAAGDEVLKQIASRLMKHCRSEDTVCRTGGDEFLYVLIDPQGRENVGRIATGLREAVTRPVAFGAEQIVIGSSIGISLYPEHGTTAQELIAKADAAMYSSKRSSGGPGWAFYDSQTMALAA